MSTATHATPVPPAPRAAQNERPADWQALASELREQLDGEVRFDDGSRALYAYDASVYRQVPIGVIVPKHADDVVAGLALCRAHDVPVFGRGCGTSLAGQCCNVGVVFDFSKYMHGIEALDADARFARVRPGTVCDVLRDAAEEHGLTFGPDPATHDHCTLGGMIGNNSCGTHSVMAGKTVDNILELDLVTYDGVRMTVGPTTDDELTQIIAGGGRRGEIYAGMKRIRDTYGGLIRERYPDIPRRVSGYNLDSLLPEKGFNVAQAVVGSESTLALVLSAKARLVPSPPQRALVVIGFDDVPSAADAVPEILEYGPIALECFDHTVVENLQQKGHRFGGERLMPDGSAWLLVEFGASTHEEAQAPARRLERSVPRHATAIKVYDEPDEETAVWEIRRHGVGSTRLPVALGDHPGWPNWEDAAVAPDRLGDYLRDFDKLLQRFGYWTAYYGHFGQGCVHCRLNYDLRTNAGIADFRRFMEEAADLVVGYGGSLSGEHGDGHGRAELLPKMFGPELVRAFGEFKALWDPAGKMNPGKIVDPYPLDTNLREGADWKPVELTTRFAFREDGGSFVEAAGRCFGVGKCRHLDGGTMCPSFMATREEMHSTRGRARLLQEMLDADGPLEDRWRSDAVKDALDLCLACKGCKGDCPVNVDMATYKAEFLSHYYQGRLRPRSAYSIGLIPIWARLASKAPKAVNAIARAPVLAPIVKALGGVAAARTIPAFAEQPFTQWFATRQGAPRGGRRVILWPDTFNNYFTPEVAIAATEVLEAAGCEVTLPKGALCCGRPFYDYGMLDLAERYLHRILDSLRDDIRAGVPLVGLEPSCVAVFRDELGNLLPDDQDAHRLGTQSFTLAEFLTDQLPDWSAPRVQAHALVQRHCHHQAVMGFEAEQKVFDAMGLDAELPDSGCCGMAGSFGYEHGDHYDVSMQCGERVILPAVRAADPSTIVMADGFSCREQIQQATGREPLHLAQVIARGLRGDAPPPRPPAHHRRVPVPAVVSAGAAVAVGAAVAHRVRNHET
jgi:FAD/FMN-containing dehydrogenase/Fe-S oxidoreductase